MNRLVIGCGFLGLPLATQWTAQGSKPPLNQGQTFAMTRSKTRAQDFAAANITPLVADITNRQSLQKCFANLPAIDTVVWAVGMDRSKYNDIYDVYVNGLQRFFDSFGQPINHFIYVSSTGVYGDFQGQWVDESAPAQPAREGGKACLQAEALIADQTDRWTVLRMAGLYGGERVPTKTVIENRNWDRLSPTGYLNLIHQIDAVEVIKATAAKKPTKEIILCSDGNPPVRRDYYQYIADRFGLGPIPWSSAAEVDPKSRSANSKRIANQKMLDLLGIELIHPDYQSGLADVFLRP